MPLNSYRGEALVKEAGSLLSKSTRQWSRWLIKIPCWKLPSVWQLKILVAVDENRCLRLNAYALLAEKGRGKISPS
jgi:hypothetical protein